MAPSQSSSSSKGSKRTCTVGGPVVLNGIAFSRVIRCPGCDLCNSDDNPANEGPLGIEFYPHVPWMRGTSENPEGKYCKYCPPTFTLAGFAAEYNNIDEFCIARREKKEVNIQWQHSYKLYIAIVIEGNCQRLKGSQKLLVQEKLGGARKEALRVFERSECLIGTKWKAICRQKYEKKHPGRVIKKGLKLKMLKIDGVRRECVMLRVTPKDEWEVTQQDVQGVEHEEEHDNGEVLLREGQVGVKFDALSAQNRNKFDGLEDALAASQDDETDAENAGVDDSDAHSLVGSMSSDDSGDELACGMQSSLLTDAVSKQNTTRGSLQTCLLLQNIK